MKEGIIFEVTKDHLQKGLRNLPVGYVSTSLIDPKKGIFYCGHSLFELVLWDPLEVIYLLLQGRQGTESEVCFFAEELQQYAECSKEFLEEVKKLSKKLDPLSLFSSALQIFSFFQSKKSFREECLEWIAMLPHLVATIFCMHGNFPEVVSCQKELGFVENFIAMLPLSISQNEKMKELFQLLCILFLDAGGGSADAFVGKVVSSAGVSLSQSCAASLLAFSGSLQAKASLYSLSLLHEIEEQTQGDYSVEEIEKFLRKKLENKELLYGFGHPELRMEDPRATLLYQFARKHFPDHPLIKIALLMRYEAPRILQESHPQISNPFANVHAIAGALLEAAGFSFPTHFPLLFSLFRMMGVAIQIFHEKSSAIKCPLVHPHYFYRAR